MSTAKTAAGTKKSTAKKKPVITEPVAEVKEPAVAEQTEEATIVSVPPVEVVADAETAPVEEPAPELHVEPKKKILFVASEAAPFIATGGLAEVIGSLSKAIAKDDTYDVRVIIPLYQDIKKEYRKDFKFIGNIFVPLSWRNQYCGIFEYEANNVRFYFVDNEYYFKRPGCYGYYDDGERFAFFCRSVMEILSFLGFYPDILHCHDWQAALAALYLKTIYCFRPEYQFIRAVFTIHNIEYQGKYSLDILEDLFGISNRYRYLVEYDTMIVKGLDNSYGRCPNTHNGGKVFIGLHANPVKIIELQRSERILFHWRASIEANFVEMRKSRQHYWRGKGTPENLSEGEDEKTFSYTITERQGDINGMTYDTTQRTVQIKDQFVFSGGSGGTVVKIGH